MAGKGRGTGPLPCSWVAGRHFGNQLRDFFGAAKHHSLSLPLLSVLPEDAKGGLADTFSPPSLRS